MKHSTGTILLKAFFYSIYLRLKYRDVYEVTVSIEDNIVTLRSYNVKNNLIIVTTLTQKS